MTALIRLLRRASALPVLLAVAALFALMVMTFFDVILRSAFDAPIAAATELTRIFMAIMVFSVLPIVSARGAHIAIDLTDNLFYRLRLTRWRDALVQIASGLMLIWPIQRIWVLAERARDHGDITEYLGIPQFYIGWFIAALTAVAALAMVTVGLLTLFAPHVLRDSA